MTARAIRWTLFAALFVVYNANGREMGTYDSQPTKFAARELALHGRLTLDQVIAKTPQLAERAGFQMDRHGHYRSAYSVVPSIIAAVPASLLHVTGLVDLRAPLAPNLIAKLTASTLTAAAVVLTFASLVPAFGTATALWVAIGLGLGTNLWPLSSGTLWQIESVSVGFALALFGWYRPADASRRRDVMLGGAGLALAVACRAQVAPMAGVLVAGFLVHAGWRRAWPAIAVLGAAGTLLVAFNWYCFGAVLGATQALQEANFAAHGVTGTFAARPWVAAAGLLVSPSRGLFVFSPVSILAVLGAVAALRRPSARGDGWWLLAVLVQFAGYSCYSMWWGGHTYGPRYLLDILVPLAPAAAAGVRWIQGRRWAQAVAAAALAYSIAVAATGAVVYPADMWNQDPEIDVNHDRLWDWGDMQIVRCWRAGPSPQNFSLFDAEAVRQEP